MAILEVKDLSVNFEMPKEQIQAVRKVSFSLNRGEVLGIVGESGSGKSTIALAILRLLSSNAKVVSGQVLFEGKDVFQLSKGELQRIRRKGIARIPQDPGNALTPNMKIATQVKEDILLAGTKRTLEELLRWVEIPDPRGICKTYPFRLSGGMKQRVLIAMALARETKIIIADEPTTALDVTVQAQILDILRTLAKRFQLGVLFITHNLGLIAEYADRVIVLEKGKMVEEDDVFKLFSSPAHPYTRALIEAVPRLDGTRCFVGEHLPAKIIFQADQVKVHFVKKNFWGREKSRAKVVDGVSFSIEEGQSLGLVGESGCGKTTLAKALIRQIPRNISDISGQVLFDKQDIFKLPSKRLSMIPQNIQLIIQENVVALNPRKSAGDQIAEVFSIHGICKGEEAERRAKQLMNQVGVNSNWFNRFPEEFSSGERQRLVIARALAVQPKVLLLDEPVASLSVLDLERILELLGVIKKEYGLSYLFISHDLSVVKEMSHRILVMYAGKIVEQARSNELVNQPLHPYTQALISSVPIPDPVVSRKRHRVHLSGEPPSPALPPSGCRFHPRCPQCTDRCKEIEPLLEDKGGGHLVACHLV